MASIFDPMPLESPAEVNAWLAKYYGFDLPDPEPTDSEAGDDRG